MLLALWICIAVITAVIASTKHRSAVGWFFIGLLFAGLGLVLAIVLPANPETAAAEAA